MKNIIIICSIIFIAAAAQAQDQRDLPLDHWAYPILERWEAKGWITLPPNKPYTRNEILVSITPLLSSKIDDNPPGIVLWMQTPEGKAELCDATELFKLDTELEGDQRFYFRTKRDLFIYRITGTPDLALDADVAVIPSVVSTKGASPNYSARGELDIWGRCRVTPTQEFLFDQRLAFITEKEQTKTQRVSSTQQTWRGGKMAIDYSYFRYANPYLSVTAGRKELWWGQGYYGTMLISTNAPTFDALSFKANYKRLGFESFIGILSTDQQRYFSGHRGTLRLPWHLTAGVSEVVLYKANNIDPVYANPLLPFYGTQWNERDDDNVLWCADAKWTPGHGIKAWGELLMDDVQYEQNPPAPQKMGFLLGGHWADPFTLANTDLIAEWAGNQKWVYTHRRHENRYMGSDTLNVIGHWIGTDGDALDLTVEHRFYPLLHVGLGYAWRRHGEGRVDRGLHYAGDVYVSGYAAPGDTVNGRYAGDDQHTRFLSGTVERQDLGVLTLRWQPWFWATLNGRFYAGYTRNAANVAGAGRHDAGGEISVKFDY